MTRSKKYRIWEGALLALLFLVIYYVLELGLVARLQPDFAAQWQHYAPWVKRLSLALFSIMVIVLAGRLMERLIDRAGDSHGVRYNLVRVTRLTKYVLIAIVIIAFAFQNLYAAAVSFGLISLVLGFALQAPITSFIGWLYIVFRRPYHVGDRIQIDGMRGDVIEIGYLDTTLRECNGVYLGNDRASGRIIRFPNATVLKSEAINYSGPFKPYIWNETPVQIAYTSDLDFVEACLRKAADDDFAEQHADHEGDQETASAVYFRVNSYAWLEAVVSYPVKPLDTTGRRNRILRRALPALNSEPDKVQFPQGAQR
ncbi:MAG TPA: mechanosensitive ion channel domain-containing protein [Oleiagrimonas sp.]|nr:mechanosensitive ion channel domain-containing protein [Oleiagrimonas sp.]